MHDGHAASPAALELLDASLDEAMESTAAESAEPSPTSRRGWLIALGVAVAVALTVLAVAATHQTESPAGADQPAPPVGLEGFAESFVATYLTASGESGLESLRRFYATPPEGATSDVGDRYVMRAVAIDATALTRDAWELRVAADVLEFDGTGYTSDGTHYYLVGVVNTESGLTATSLPARVATPPPAPIAVAAAAAPVEDPGTLALVDGFLDAYLTGKGDLRSFVAEPRLVAPVTPPPFETVVRTSLSATAAGDGTQRLRILATGTGTNGVVTVVEYHLSVVVNGGAYAIGQVHGGPPPIDDEGGPYGDELGDT